MYIGTQYFIHIHSILHGWDTVLVEMYKCMAMSVRQGEKYTCMDTDKIVSVSGECLPN